ncbi:MAG TPA: hypothetical protein VGM59_06435 [Dongiaceae bacterium]
MRRFVIGFGGVCAVIAIFCGLSVAVLRTNLEHISPVEAAQIQVKRGGLYGSALVYRPYPYKLELYRLEQPDVAIVGSSRAMGFVADGFAAPMTDLGGAVNEIVEAEQLIPDMLRIHHPKLLLFTLDFWWFNQQRYIADAAISRSSDVSFTLSDILSPAEWLFKGRVKRSKLLKTMFAPAPEQPLIGVEANQNHAGFDRNGTRFYGSILTGGAKFDDPRFKRTLARLKSAKSDSKLGVTQPFSEEAWSEVMQLARMAQAAGVDFRFIVPPMAGPVMERVHTLASRTLIDDLHDHLSRSGVTFYDFSDPASLDAPDCEFVDGFHGGFVVYLRILRKVAQDMEARPDLRALIQPDAVLANLIDRNKGRATLRGQEWAGKENDYLKLGCPKN